MLRSVKEVSQVLIPIWDHFVDEHDLTNLCNSGLFHYRLQVHVVHCFPNEKVIITVYKSKAVSFLVRGSPGGVKICLGVHKGEVIQFLGRGQGIQQGGRNQWADT